MIKRYIDTDELIDFFDSYPDHIEFDVEDIKSIINEQDAADVRKNIKSTWKYDGKFYYKCRRCGYDASFRFNFCPNCGAQMER